ncbi:hypothetical protein SRB5_26030 [Streptomyces sp. RB5]|uniref:Bacterial CdiA-CT RNAse A domain-containing protein n=1 Tax=Streptomyces smaragdinus TaxID=2585196 RepID=A0A7K0CG67_9ACTN|nr:RNase A-like domain-containing protein [Streptomyces smaragdinus]MQY12469.1 hypothetical protein [Streptomyces smaragdinus]
MSKKLPTDQERKAEAARARVPKPSAGGGFDVQPQHVFYTSLMVRDGQFDYDKGAKSLVDVLNNYSQSAGAGKGADDFAAAYKSVNEKFLHLWARSVVSVGGVSVGLTDTANKYVLADWHASARYGPPPPQKPLPAVIHTPPTYGPVNEIKWSGTGRDADSWALSGALGEIPDALAGLIRPAIEHGLRLGKTHEITPGAESEEFTAMAEAWRAVAEAANSASKDFNTAIKFITNSKGNDEWQGAMKAFCQTIWGTTEWGRTLDGQGNRVSVPKGPEEHEWATNRKVQPSKRRPIIEILVHTAKTVQAEFTRLAEVRNKTEETTSKLGADAARATVRDLTTDLDLVELTKLTATLTFGEIVMTFRSHMDKSGCDQAVEAYHQAFSESANKLRALEHNLGEALLSVPSFNAEAARAEGYGARSLNDFKKDHSWQRPNAPVGKYSLDLATEEELFGSHSIDKHVGLTDEQLNQRLRDETSGSGTEPDIPAASSFTDIESAQRFTEYTLDNNSTAIGAWLKGPPPPSPGETKAFSVVAVTNGTMGPEITGRTVPVTNGQIMPARYTHGVETVLKYEPNLQPPYVVYTSMPS